MPSARLASIHSWRLIAAGVYLVVVNSSKSFVPMDRKLSMRGKEHEPLHTKVDGSDSICSMGERNIRRMGERNIRRMGERGNFRRMRGFVT